MKIQKLTTVVLITLVVLGTCGSVFGVDYQITDLGTLGGSESWANGINNSGQIVGQIRFANGDVHAFIWGSSSGMTDIYQPGTSMTGASQINDAGQVVGPMGVGGTVDKAFLWDSVNGMIYLDETRDSYAIGINNTGTVVGQALLPQGHSSYWHAFIWDYSNGMIDLGTLGGSLSEAKAINDAGQVVGGSFIGSNSAWHAYVWDSVNGMQDIGTFGDEGTGSWANAINNFGQVVGLAQKIDRGAGYPFIWDSVNGMTELGTPGAWMGEATAINNSGQVVGCLDNTPGEEHAFLWDSTNGMIDLHPLLTEHGFNGRSRATGINDQGQIVGHGEISGEMHAFLVTPCFTTWHVDGATGDNGNDGLSRETAFETIQYAIDTAEDGDTVLVWPGVYNEVVTHGINFKGKAITVTSAADAAVLEVPGFVAVTFAQGENENSVLSNFVIRGSYTGVFAFYSSPTINNVTVADNVNGVIADNADPVITNSIFANNTNGDLFDCTAQYSFIGNAAADANLVAYWKLDGDAIDSAGTNDGTIYGATPTTGQINDALSFDGNNDYVEIGDKLNDVGLPFSIATWANVHQEGAYGVFASDNPTSGNYYGFWLGMGYNYIDITYGDGTGQSSYDWRTKKSDLSIPLNTWIFITAVVRGATDMDIYLNGVDVGGEYTGSGGSMVHNFKKVVIGDLSIWQYNHFNGEIDDMRIYNRALNAEEIEAMYEAGLAGHSYGEPGFADANSGDYHLLSERGRYRPLTDEWVFDDGTSPCIDAGDPNIEPTKEPMPNGGRINIGAYGNTATASLSEWQLRADLDRVGSVDINDMEIFTDQWLDTTALSEEPTGTALDFDGVDDYVEIGDSPELRLLNTDFTILSWIKPEDVATLSHFLGNRNYNIFDGSGSNSGWGTLIENTELGFVIFGQSACFTNGANIIADSWHFVCYVFHDSDNTMDVYSNGELIQSLHMSEISSSNKSVIIGATTGNVPGPRNVFNGLLDEVRIYRRALTETEIEDIYHSGVIADANLVGYWDFEEGEGQVAADKSGNGNDGQLGSTPDADSSDPAWTASEVPGVTYHVDGATGDNSNNGLTKETAFATIQKAVSEAEDGDTILVWPGVYSGPVYIVEKAVTIKSADTPAVIDGGYDDGVACYTWQDKQVAVKNFIIKNGYAGVYVNSGSPMLENLTIVDCYTGIEAETGAEPNIISCILSDNDYDLWNCTANYSYIQEDETDANLVAYWKLDGDANDSAGTNDGTIHSTEVYYPAATPTTGYLDGALDFDGVDDYVLINQMTLSTNWTLTGWFKYSYLGDEEHNVIMGKAITSYYDYIIFRHNVDDIEVETNTNGDSAVICEGVVNSSLDEWAFYAITRNGNIVSGYKDGEFIDSDTLPTGDDNTITAIGKGYSDHHYDGLMDDLRIYDRALSAEEIQAIYEVGLAGGEYGSPLFADANDGDYHLLSERGRYRPATDEWLLDGISSPAIDGGDPNAALSNEPMPNGGRINMGAYGRTSEASMSEWPMVGDLNLDGIVNFADYAAFAQKWLETEEWKE